ncbi:DUF2695 domain-containing protein [Amycolatopsis sp. TRM77291]
MDALYDWLDERLGVEGCDHSLRLTEVWASERVSTGRRCGRL